MTGYHVPQLIPYVGEEELGNLRKAIETQWITEGPFAKQFLDMLKEFTGATFAVLANNGTLGLFLGLMALGIEEGDEVIVPDFTFIASGTSVVFAGGKPVFVDVDPGHYSINVEKIEDAITEKTKAIMPVHIYGQCADMDPILTIARKYSLKVIEDAAQSYGVFYKGRHTGTIGDVGMISFFADKTVTTGEGAVVLTNDKKVYEKLRFLRNQGRHDSGSFVHPYLGMNFRMTDLQCTVGVAQLKRFKEIEDAKLSNFNLYKELLGDLEQITFMNELPYCNFVPFRVPIRVKRLAALMDFFEKKGIQPRGFFYPLHRQPCLAYLGYAEGEFPVSNMLFDEGAALPVYMGITQEQIRYVCKNIRMFFENG